VSTINDLTAEVLSAFGRKAEALDHLNRSASYIFPMLEANRENVNLYRNAAGTYYTISTIECDLGLYDKALLNAEKAVETIKGIAERDPENADLAKVYAMTLFAKAKALVRGGRPAEGLPILSDVLGRARSLEASDPANEITQIQIAYVNDEIGRAYLAIGSAETDRSARSAALQKARSSLQQ